MGTCHRYYCMINVFFVKQKTAYEMRISDWSSDVCSSDRVQQVDDILGGHVARGAAGIGAAAQSGDRGVDHRHAELEAGEDVGERLAVGVVEMHRQEIGRASCRERVCQYV